VIILEKCVCGHWCKSRTQLFRHGGRCKLYQAFSRAWKEVKAEVPDASWKQFKEAYMEDNCI